METGQDYLAPQIEVQQHPEKGGCGIFATAPIPAGTLLILWGGRIVTGAQFAELPAWAQRFSLQVEADLYQISFAEDEPGNFVNHSCDPNAGLRGQIALVAMHDIAPGEEICFDYAMSDSSPYDEFTCACGAARCRGQVTGRDWRLSELQQRYDGYFSAYLQRRIAAQQSGDGDGD